MISSRYSIECGLVKAIVYQRFVLGYKIWESTIASLGAGDKLAYIHGMTFIPLPRKVFDTWCQEAEIHNLKIDIQQMINYLNRRSNGLFIRPKI